MKFSQMKEGLGRPALSDEYDASNAAFDELDMEGEDDFDEEAAFELALQSAPDFPAEEKDDLGDLDEGETGEEELPDDYDFDAEFEKENALDSHFGLRGKASRDDEYEDDDFFDDEEFEESKEFLMYKLNKIKETSGLSKKAFFKAIKALNESEAKKRFRVVYTDDNGKEVTAQKEYETKEAAIAEMKKKGYSEDEFKVEMIPFKD